MNVKQSLSDMLYTFCWIKPYLTKEQITDKNLYPRGQQASGQIAHTANKKNKLSLAGPVENASHLKLKTNDYVYKYFCT